MSRPSVGSERVRGGTKETRISVDPDSDRPTWRSSRFANGANAASGSVRHSKITFDSDGDDGSMKQSMAKYPFAAVRESRRSEAISCESVSNVLAPAGHRYSPLLDRKSAAHLTCPKTFRDVRAQHKHTHAGMKEMKTHSDRPSAANHELAFWQKCIAELSVDPHKAPLPQVVPKGCPVQEEHGVWRKLIDELSAPTPGASSANIPPRGASHEEEVDYWRKRLENLCSPTETLVSDAEARHPHQELIEARRHRHYWSFRDVDGLLERRVADIADAKPTRSKRRTRSEEPRRLEWAPSGIQELPKGRPPNLKGFRQEERRRSLSLEP